MPPVNKGPGRGFQRQCKACKTTMNIKVTKCTNCGHNLKEEMVAKRREELRKHESMGQKLAKSRNPGHVHTLVHNQMAKYTGMGYTAICLYVTPGITQPSIGVISHGPVANTLEDNTFNALKAYFKDKVVTVRKTLAHTNEPEANEIEEEPESQTNTADLSQINKPNAKTSKGKRKRKESNELENIKGKHQRKEASAQMKTMEESRRQFRKKESNGHKATETEQCKNLSKESNGHKATETEQCKNLSKGLPLTSVIDNTLVVQVEESDKVLEHEVSQLSNFVAYLEDL